MGRYESRRRKKKRVMRSAVYLAVALAGVTAFSVMAYRMVDQQDAYQAEDFSADGMIGTMEKDGVKYRPKTRMQTYLFMGIDTWAEESEDESGQCDVLTLVVVDQNEDTYAVIPVNRNTVTEVKSLEDDGTYIATSKVQIALAHAMGDGGAISCENTVDAVSNLFGGITIDNYAALTMDAIKVLNHMAGGVTVTIEDDFSEADPSLKPGAVVTLTDDQAELFVRGRMNVGDGTNEGRMRRQQQYLEALGKNLEEKFRADETYVTDVYDALQNYMVTNLTGNDCSRLAKALLENEPLGTLEIKGDISEDYLEYSEFIPDQASIDELVIDLFYDEM